MINSATFKFLKDLKKNNTKEWLDANKEKYDLAKKDVVNLAEQLIAGVATFDKTIANVGLPPKQCVTRLNRDLRFAKDKTPYKNDYYIIINKNGTNSSSAFYYLHIEPGNCFVGGGIWNPQPEQLKKARQEIDYSFLEWTNIISDSSFKKTFPCGIQSVGVLSKVPKGYDESNPALAFLKMKGFCTKESIADREIMAPGIIDTILDYFRATKPLVDFLNKAIDND